MSTPDSGSTIRPARRGDEAMIKRIAVQAGLFGTDEVDALDPMLAGYLSGELEDQHWLVLEGANAELTAAAYVAPEAFADRMWNLYFLAVSPSTQGRGLGHALLQHVESQLRAMGDSRARTLIVETSSTSKFAGTREFYARHGFVEEARIREYYGPDDHKVVYWKRLVGEAVS